MASQEDGEEKLVRYPAGDKKLDKKDESKGPFQHSNVEYLQELSILNNAHHNSSQLPTC